MKKNISIFCVLIVAGASMISSVSAETTETTPDTTGTTATATSTTATTTSVTTESSGSVVSPMPNEDINSTTCRNIGTRSEGLYFPNGKLYRWSNCWEEMKQEVKDQKIEMKQEGTMVPQIVGNDFGKSPMLARELGGFLRTPLTKEEQDAVVTLLRAQQLERDVIMDDVSLTMEAKATKMRELTSAHMTALLVYISTDKQDLFKKIMEERMSMMAKKPEVRKEFKEEIKQQKQEFKEEIKGQKQEFKNQIAPALKMQAKKQALSEKNRIILEKAVNTFSLEKLQTILTKVTKALWVAKKEKVLAQLKEIEELVQNKINELTGASSEEDVLWDILGTTDTTTTGTGTTTVTQ